VNNFCSPEASLRTLRSQIRVRQFLQALILTSIPPPRMELRCAKETSFFFCPSRSAAGVQRRCASPFFFLFFFSLFFFYNGGARFSAGQPDAREKRPSRRFKSFDTNKDTSRKRWPNEKRTFFYTCRSRQN
jgi:hypothetical protein